MALELPGSVLIFGCGYVGTALALRLREAGIRVGALTRNREKADGLRREGIDEVVVAELDSEAWYDGFSGRYEAVVNCVSSAGGGLEGYRKSYLRGQQSILKWLGGRPLRRYIYTSSTSVYPQDGGQWVDEEADTSAAPPTGQVLLESEALLGSAAGSSIGRWYVLRLAGIYGPGRHYLIDQLRSAGSGAVIPGRGDYALNMIHRDDIVTALLASLDLATAPAAGVYNLADDQPALKQEVLGWLAGRLQLEEPHFAPDQVSERLARRGGKMPNRCICNRKFRESFAWQPRYPSFREGYETILEGLTEHSSDPGC